MKVKTGDLTTYYQQIGDSKKVVVLLHGWGCDWQIWSPLISELSKKYQLLIPDLPAFGSSDTPSEVWDSREYVRWLQEFIEVTLGNQEFSLVGHSFGGKIAVLFAALNKSDTSRLNKLVIMDASGLPVDLSPKEQLVYGFSQLLPAFIKKQLGKKVKTKILQKAGVAADYQQANEYQQKVLKKIVRENIHEDLKKISTPALVIWGAHDEATPLSKGREFATAIPGAQLEVMENSGHYPFVDETEKCIKVLLKFL